jgi:hypothetical protein
MYQFILFLKVLNVNCLEPLLALLVLQRISWVIADPSGKLCSTFICAPATKLLTVSLTRSRTIFFWAFLMDVARWLSHSSLENGYSDTLSQMA